MIAIFLYYTHQPRPNLCLFKEMTKENSVVEYWEWHSDTVHGHFCVSTNQQHMSSIFTTVSTILTIYVLYNFQTMTSPTAHLFSMSWWCHKNSDSYNKHKQHADKKYIRFSWWSPILSKDKYAPKGAHKWKCLCITANWYEHWEFGKHACVIGTRL